MKKSEQKALLVLGGLGALAFLLAKTGGQSVTPTAVPDGTKCWFADRNSPYYPAGGYGYGVVTGGACAYPGGSIPVGDSRIVAYGPLAPCRWPPWSPYTWRPCP
jgi:hypothetical protein